MIELGVIYCKFTEYFWSAQFYCEGRIYRTVKRTHNSARQAADEMLEQLRAATSNHQLSLQRRSPKVYAIVAPKETSHAS